MTTPRIPAAAVRDRLRSALGALREVVGSVEPGAVTGEEALELVNLLGETERAAASGMARLTPRVIRDPGHSPKRGSARLRIGWPQPRAPPLRPPAAAWLRPSMRHAHRSCPGRFERESSRLPRSVCWPRALSKRPMHWVTWSSWPRVLRASRNSPMLQARPSAAARTRESARLRRAHVHRARHLRWRQDERGGVRGEFLCDEVAWARVAPILEARAKARAKAAGHDDQGSLDAHRLDAFVELLGAPAASESAGTTRPHALVVVDAAALQRGSLGQGEQCEIEGIGSVSVEAVTELLGEAMARFVIKSGRDIASVTSSTRWIPPSTAAALVVRDRCCVVPGCGKRLGLEIDHCRVDYADGGPTTLENLARLCPEHHDMKTHGGWKLVRAKGRWRWSAPENPPSAGRIARARRLAAVRNRRQ